MSKNTESLISQLLDAARAAGADGADAGMSRSEGTSVTVRLGKVESSERSEDCLLYTSPSPRDRQKYRMPSSA